MNDLKVFNELLALDDRFSGMKRCPFCGGGAAVKFSGHGFGLKVYLECIGCGLHTPEYGIVSEAEVSEDGVLTAVKTDFRQRLYDFWQKRTE